jgi:hypothetical protein
MPANVATDTSYTTPRDTISVEKQCPISAVILAQTMIAQLFAAAVAVLGPVRATLPLANFRGRCARYCYYRHRRCVGFAAATRLVISKETEKFASPRLLRTALGLVWDLEQSRHPCALLRPTAAQRAFALAWSADIIMLSN